ncbi:Rv3235 family protein [Gordonia araii]|nr:Rv3235 family protein [Gordonia araii]NNG97509.1 hypothetical protein [Gordonia araii NBRC 100433]
MYMETSHVVLRPAPPFEHPGRWAEPCDCATGGPPQRRPERVLRSVPLTTSADQRPSDQIAISAREFAIAAMTVVLEVVDGRRPVTALRPLAAQPVIDHVVTKGRARFGSGAATRPGTAGMRLRRVHIQLTDDGQAEFYGSYSCGERVRAFAGRIVTAKPSGRGTVADASERAKPRWRVQGLMLD